MHCLRITKNTKTDYRLSSMLLLIYHKRTKTSNDIDTNLSSLQSQPSCSWPVPFFSRFPSVLERWLCSLLIRRRSQLKNASTKWQSPWRIVELNRRIILPLQDDVICPSVVIIFSDSWIFCLLIWTPLSLFPSSIATSLRSFFILSLRLTITAAVQDRTPEAVLS